jgi:hypothetical protein
VKPCSKARCSSLDPPACKSQHEALFLIELSLRHGFPSVLEFLAHAGPLWVIQTDRIVARVPVGDNYCRDLAIPQEAAR